MAKLLVFAGSARRDSVNKKAARAAFHCLEARGIEVTFVDLKDYPSAIYDGDDEAKAGVPETMRALKKLLYAHDGVILSTPEYNGNIPPLLSNLFAWCSRAEEGEASSQAFAGKFYGLMAASPGGLGGVRVIPRLRDALAELGAMSAPGFVTLPKAFDAFNEDGSFADDKHTEAVNALADRVLAKIN